MPSRTAAPLTCEVNDLDALHGDRTSAACRVIGVQAVQPGPAGRLVVVGLERDPTAMLGGPGDEDGDNDTMQERTALRCRSAPADPQGIDQLGAWGAARGGASAIRPR